MVTAEQRAVAVASRAGDLAWRDGPVGAVARAWGALAGVPDPEVPCVSIVELGIVREVREDGAALVVAVTPTYSGCPATDVIMADIVAALERVGIAQARVEMLLAPAWTTDWIAPEGRDKLRAFGIAPPPAVAQPVDVAGISPLRRRAEAVACPRCGATATRLVAQFGSTACKAQYRCEACLEPFDYFKPF
jgi:ring-1,2-phenylacetyl-CoA epoxidase subunit PaaD